MNIVVGFVFRLRIITLHIYINLVLGLPAQHPQQPGIPKCRSETSIIVYPYLLRINSHANYRITRFLQHKTGE